MTKSDIPSEYLSDTSVDAEEAFTIADPKTMRIEGGQLADGLEWLNHLIIHHMLIGSVVKARSCSIAQIDR